MTALKKKLNDESVENLAGPWFAECSLGPSTVPKEWSVQFLTACYQLVWELNI